MNETRLTNKIRASLRMRGGLWFKIHGGAMQTTGIPDIVGCYRGQFVAFEVKLPGKEGTLTKRQRWTLIRIRQHGGLAAVVTSVEAALKLLDNIDSVVTQNRSP